MRKIHPKAEVSKKAELGKDVVVGPFAVIDANVKIGDGTVIGPHAYITGYTTIGKGNEIFNGACIGSRPQDLKYKGEKTYLEIGDNNLIREFTTLNPGTEEGGGRTVVGSNNLIMAYAHIAHDCRIGNHCIIVNCGSLAGHVVVEDHAVISGLVAVHQFVRIGKLAIIGGCSKVVQDIPPFSTCDGHPARVFGLNRIGLRRNKFPVPVIKELDTAFNIIFNSGIPVKKALEKLDKEKNPSEDVNYLINFIKSSSRGITRSCRAAHNGDEE
ncbi:MAG: acyl-ACP--UDP-N-acetylglucosamine O-acyltransferase [Deltaproteobacteria bacterium]